MQIIMCFMVSDDCTYHCEETIPIFYESLEAAAVDFEVAVMEGERYSPFFFAGRMWHKDAFRNGQQYTVPEFYTVDEWFKAYSR